jgi:hypothetical protein
VVSSSQCSAAGCSPGHHRHQRVLPPPQKKRKPPQDWLENVIQSPPTKLEPAPQASPQQLYAQRQADLFRERGDELRGRFGCARCWLGLWRAVCGFGGGGAVCCCVQPASRAVREQGGQKRHSSPPPLKSIHHRSQAPRLHAQGLPGAGHAHHFGRGPWERPVPLWLGPLRLEQ